MKRLLVIFACSLFANGVWAQEILNRTNEVGMSIQDHTLTMNRGSARLNIVVTEAGDPKSMTDIDTFRLTVKDLTDGRIVPPVTQDTTGDNIDASIGQVRFVISTLTDRGIDPDYELEAYAVADDTNNNYRIHWGYLSVTSAPVASSTILVSNFIPITVTANVAGVSVVTTVLVDNVYSPSNNYFVTINQTNLTVVNITNQLDNITETITYNYSAGVHSVNSATGTVMIYDRFGLSFTNDGNNLYIAEREPVWLTFAPTVTVPVVDYGYFAYEATDTTTAAFSGVATGKTGIATIQVYTPTASDFSISSSNVLGAGDLSFTNGNWHTIIYSWSLGTNEIRVEQY